MIDLGRDGLPHDKALRVLSFFGGRRQVRYEMLSYRNGVQHLSLKLVSHEFTFSYLSPVKFSGVFRFYNNPNLDLSTDLLELSMVLRYNGAEYRYPFTRLKAVSAKGGSVLTVKAKDETEALRRAALGAPLILPAGTRYTEAVESLLSGSGFYNIAVEPSAMALGSQREYVRPDMSRLTVINELLAEIGYRSLECLPGGLVSSGRYTLPEDESNYISYKSGRESVVLRGAAKSNEYLLPNSFFGFVSQPKLPPLTAQYSITGTNSPVSPLRNGGYTIVAVKEFKAAADSAALETLLKRFASEASTKYETVTLFTAVMPHHGVREVVHLDLGEYSGLFVETGFRITDKMEHTLRRVKF